MHIQRSGVSLIETLVAVAIIVVLAVAFIPNLQASTDRMEVRDAAVTIEELMDAILTMRYDNQDWPARLSHVSTPITTSNQNICGDNYNNGRVNNWTGPYVDYIFPTTGLPIGIGHVRDLMEREVISGNPKGGGAISLVRVYVDNVPEELAIELNRIVDGDNDQTAGTIRWADPAIGGTGLTTVEWVRTIKGC